jgi:hypothetical protein
MHALPIRERLHYQSEDSCISIEKSQRVRYKDGTSLRKYNPWINYDCSNLQVVSDVAYGHVICLSPSLVVRMILPLI